MISHLTRSSAALRAALVIVLALVLLATAAPSSFADIYEDDGGKPGKGGDYSAPPPPPGMTWHCTEDGALVRDGYGIVYDAVHPGCRGFEATNKFRLCQPSMQVFRFYGTVQNPTTAWTTSMAAQQWWCDPTQVYMWSTSAYDRHPGVTEDNYDKEEMGDISHPDLGHQPQLDTLNNRGYQMHPMYAMKWTLRGVNRLTSGRAFDGEGDCREPQNRTNPIRKELDNEDLPFEYRQEVAREMTDYLNRSYRRFRNDFGPGKDMAALRAARKSVGIMSTDVDRARVVTVNRDCASSMRYVVTADITKLRRVEERRLYRVTGVCYIPVERLARRYEKSEGGRVVQEREGWPSILNKGYGGGLRYSNYYKGTPHTQGNFRSQIDHLPDRYERAVVNKWRKTMRKWYLNSTTSSVSSLMSGGTQTLPAQPYVVTGTGSRRAPNVAASRGLRYNQQAAAAALANYSRCKFGDEIVHFEAPPQDPTEEPEEPDVSSQLVINNQHVYEAGGYRAADQGVTITDSGLRCGAACSNGFDVQFQRLSYTATIQMPAGWTAKAWRNPESRDPAMERKVDTWISRTRGAFRAKNLTCSGNTCTLDVVATTPGSSVTVSKRFFQPTLGAERVKVTVSNPSVAFTYKRIITRTIPNGEGGVIRTEVVVPRRATITPSLSGTPVRLSGGSYSAPVIGAKSDNNG